MRRFRVVRLRLSWERAFWVIPLVGVIAGVVLHEVVAGVDDLIAARGLTPRLVAASSASQLLGAIGGGMITFVGFVFSFVVLILQFGSSQYSPRTVSYFLRARSTRYILAIFLGTITFTFVGLLDVSSLGREDFAPDAVVLVAIGLLFASLVAFIVLLHSVGSRVRVDAVLSAMGRHARGLLTERLDAATSAAAPQGHPDPQAAEHALVRSVRSGQTIGIDPERLLRVASRHGLNVAVMIQVGDAVSVGTPILRVEGGGTSLPGGVESALRRGVVIDVERSLQYDPFYALRLLADISVRALSPGVNDPTTSVRALDEIEGVLRVAAGARLGPWRLTSGAAQVEGRAPTWRDVVYLGLLETITCGADAPQVSRRLVALFDDLDPDVSDEQRTPLTELREELAGQVRAGGSSTLLAAVALSPDRQGLGGRL